MLSIMSEEYKDVAHIYQAMVPDETLRGQTTANPFMAQALYKLQDGSCVLDAACGCGWDAIAIHNGLPGMGDKRKKFNVCASDGSVHMVGQARKNFLSCANGTFIDLRQAMLSELSGHKDWRNFFDAVIIPNAIGTLPRGMSYDDYDNYIVRSFEGVRSVVSRSSQVLVDSRDWTKSIENKLKITRRINRHGQKTFLAEYVWLVGGQPNAIHSAEMTIWDNTEKKGHGFRECLKFAGKTPESLAQLFEEAGFCVTNKWAQRRGMDGEPFITFALCPR